MSCQVTHVTGLEYPLCGQTERRDSHENCPVLGEKSAVFLVREEKTSQETPFSEKKYLGNVASAASPGKTHRALLSAPVRK